VLQTEVLLVNPTPELWQDVASRLRPFVARQVPPTDVDDVLQDVFVRMQRGLSSIRDEERFTSWLFQVARSSVAEHVRAKARHPVAAGEEVELPAPPTEDDDREASRSLSSCVSLFVARLPSPYREAVTLISAGSAVTARAYLRFDALAARRTTRGTGRKLGDLAPSIQRDLAALFEHLPQLVAPALHA
jgi:RNA polymerase sigma-70 factor (ECF subfamily)